MKEGIAEIKDIKDVSINLSTENKRYVIAVANALLFSQKNDDQSCQQQDNKRLEKEL
ncbi:MAG: hypothetical protein HFI34_11735 [Lachnospiraceae bacterium]|nr:hypothetical protein [Lachnospiraceae bacterium]